MKKTILVLFLIFGFIHAISQTTMNLDSLLSLLPEAKQDSNAVKLYINIGEQYETNNPEIAKQYYRKAGQLSASIQYVAGFCRFAADYSAVLNMQGDYDSSLFVNQKSLKAAQSINNELLINKSLFNIGNCYNYMEQYETALIYYQKVAPYFEKTDNKAYKSLFFDVMHMLYQNLERYDKAIFYGEKALALCHDQLNSNTRGTILMNLSVSYSKNDPPETEKAMAGYQEALRIAKLNQNLYLESSVLVNLADHFYQLRNYEKARQYYTEVLPIQIQIDDQKGICMTKRGLSYYELYKNRFSSSEELLQQALSIAQKNYFLNEEQECLASLAEVYMAQNDYPKYHYFAQKHDSVSNLIVNEKILRATQDLELKYETEKKQSQILLLEKDKKLRNVSIIGLLIIMFLLSVKGFFFIRNLNRKRQLVEKDAELKAQRISELETERQLTATQALLQGEEAERKRLARDLHDGLGGMLSVIKLNLTNMKGNAILPETDIPAFENALEMLDGSIRELRRVAHNLMPESLMRYGLKAALSDFCGSIDIVKLHYFGNDQRMDERYEVAIFRIAQELVNNAIKHSKSRQINVQVIQEQERINLVVQDNGIGFNPDKLKDMNTSGLSSIRSRVESLKGQLDFFSEPQKGTEVQVNFNF